MWLVLISALLLVAIAIVGLSVRIVFKKDGSFLHRCAMPDIDMGDGKEHSCEHCKLPEGGKHEDCPSFQMHHGTVFSQTAEAIKMIEDDKKE